MSVSEPTPPTPEQVAATAAEIRKALGDEAPAPKVTMLEDDPNDRWAEVELFRWQYGELPGGGDYRQLDAAVGLRNMADALEASCKGGSMEDAPSPFAVCSVLRFVAGRFDRVKRRLIKQSQAHLTKGKIGRNDPCPCGSRKKYKLCCARAAQKGA